MHTFIRYIHNKHLGYNNQSINLFSQLCSNENEFQQNNVEHSDGLP